jgi:hypothetical protein
MHSVHFVLMDPQPRVRETLTTLARWLNNTLAAKPRWVQPQRFSADSATFMPVAAWTAETRLPFFASVRKEDSQTSSLVRAAQHGDSARAHVRAIDLAAFLRKTFDGASLRLLKLDVEAAEYELLPHLLVTGALCLATHLLLEWHLNSLPPSRRLRALAMRLSIDEHLEKGCGAANLKPPRVAHDEFELNNRFAVVTGLDQLIEQHNGTWPASCGTYCQTSRRKAERRVREG